MLMKLPLVRKDRRFFYGFYGMESRIMKKIFTNNGYESLLPSGGAAPDADRKNEIE